MFLARQLSLRCTELGSPTIVMIVDRDDLQTQAGKLFLRSEEFLSLGAAKIIADRNYLRLSLRILADRRRRSYALRPGSHQNLILWDRQ